MAERSGRDPSPARSPWAHLAGYALVALAIYLGLRSWGEARAPAPTATPSATIAPRAAESHGRRAEPAVREPEDAGVVHDAGEFVEAGAPPSGSDALRAKVTRAIDAQLEKARPSLAARCWAGRSQTVSITVRLLVTADGKVRSRGFRPETGQDDALVECLRTAPLTLSAPAPGEDVAVVTTLELP
jgi:hypothetical protein